jgi:hypothetical protein
VWKDHFRVFVILAMVLALALSWQPLKYVYFTEISTFLLALAAMSASLEATRSQDLIPARKIWRRIRTRLGPLLGASLLFALLLSFLAGLISVSGLLPSLNRSTGPIRALIGLSGWLILIYTFAPGLFLAANILDSQQGSVECLRRSFRLYFTYLPGNFALVFYIILVGLSASLAAPFLHPGLASFFMALVMIWICLLVVLRYRQIQTWADASLD